MKNPKSFSNGFKQEEEAAAALLGDFVASFAEKKTSQTFVKTGTIVQTENRQMVVESEREEYKMDGMSKLNSQAVCTLISMSFVNLSLGGKEKR